MEFIAQSRRDLSYSRANPRGTTGRNWEALGAIAEAVGVVAIFVSLIYVAAQIRLSTKQAARAVEASELEAVERKIDTGHRVRDLLILNPDLVELMLTGFRGYNSLADVEQFRFNLLLRNVFAEIQGAYVRHIRVNRSPEDFEGSQRVLDELLVNRGVQEWLQSTEPDWRPTFRDLVDRRLEALGSKQ